MAIDGVNFAMNALQFSFARSASRAVEMNAAMTSQSNGGRSAGLGMGDGSGMSRSITPERTVVLPSLRWSYQPVVVNGRRAAKLTPQLTESVYLKSTVNQIA